LGVTSGRPGPNADGKVGELEDQLAEFPGDTRGGTAAVGYRGYRCGYHHDHDHDDDDADDHHDHHDHHSSSFVIIINRKNHIMIFSVLDVSAIRSYTGSLQLAGALASFTKNSTRIMAISGSFPQKVHLPNK
jgi:hypothetical protein